MKIYEKKERVIRDSATANGNVFISGGGSSFDPTELETKNANQDTSIAWLDASTRKLFTQNIAQDASIIEIRSKNSIIDASIIELRTKNINQDTSIAWLDASTRKLFTQNIAQDASLNRHEASIGNILNGTTTFKGAKTFSNQIISDNGMKSSNFVPGLSGYACGSTAQFENLTIINDLNVRTIRNNIITAENGTRILNQSVTAVDTSTEGAGINHDANGYYFNVETWLNSMQIGFPIVAQSQSASGIETLEYVVTDISNGRVYVNITDSSTQTTPVSSITNVNIGTFNYVFPPGFYSIQATGDGQYCKTPDFHAPADSSVYITFANTAINFGTMSVALYTKDGSLYNTLWSAASSVIGTRGANITEDVSLHTRFILTSSGHNVNLYAPSQRVVTYIAAETPNVKGRTFVRVNGNPIIDTAVLPWAPGTRWLKNTSDALNHTQDDIFASIADNYDISVNGNYLTYGAYLPNACITGYAEINEGKIANILLKNGGLSSSLDGQRWELDVNNGGLFCYDVSNNATVSIHTGDIQDLDDITDIINKNYIDLYATLYTTKAIENNVATPQTYMYYTGEYESNNNYIKTWDNIPAADYQFDVNIDNRYYIVQYKQVDYSYTVPNNYIENPGDNQITHTFSTYGSYNITFDTSILNNNNVTLGGHSITINNRVSQNLVCVPINNIVTFDISKGYFSEKVTITNNFKIKEVITYYGAGAPVYTYETIYPADVTFTLKTTSCRLSGSSQFIEIGDNGMNAVFNSDKYFSLQKNRDDEYFIKTAGNQYHTSSNFRIVTDNAVIITGDLAVSETTKVKGFEFDEKYSTSSTYNLSNIECLYIFGGGTGGSTVTMPSSPLTGQQHIIINRTPATTLTITGGAKDIYDNGSTVPTFALGNRHSATLIYNGVAWSLVAYR